MKRLVTMSKFAASSLGTTLFELAVFTVLFAFFKVRSPRYAEIICTVIGRMLSSLLNFSINNFLVFSNKGSKTKAFVRYYCLCIPQMCASAGLLTLINRLFRNSRTLLTTGIKVVVDVTLFFISYGIQKKWVFSKTSEQEEPVDTANELTGEC